jgi:uncharacterized protein YndB with AHSA1/START domain
MPKTTFEVDRDTLEVRMSRVINASPEKIWDAYTDPVAIPQWWGPAKYTTNVEKMDVKVGGEWRYTQKDADGNEFAFHGEYTEVVAPERLVSTFIFEGTPDSVITDTLTLEEQPDGTTRISSVSVFSTPEDLEGMVGAGMEGGARESWERLATLTEKGE